MRKDYNLEKRKYVIGGFIVVVVAIYLCKLFDLQILDDKYSEIAVSNARSTKVTHPSRGQIYDRNGNLVVYNEPAYDLVLVPKDVQEFDTTTMCKILQLKRSDFELLWKNMSDPKKNKNYSATTPQPLVQNLDSTTYGRLQEILYRFPGFDISQRIIRRYNYVAAANVLGDIREVNAEDIERDSDNYYMPGDYTGDLGVEKSYEKYLRGVKGKEILIRDARGKIKGRYNDGKDDVQPVAGKDLQLSIDIELQQFGEKIMRGKRGAIVAIEPKTGEVLALVTSPCYDPALLVGKDRGKNYAKLVSDPSKPLFDRAIMAAYPPGSTFKPSQGLIFMQEGITNLSTSYPCYRGYINKGLKVGCHGHGSPISLQPALATSCNGYFCWGLYYMLKNHKYENLDSAFTVWKNYMVEMGYGYKLNIDLPAESRGFIPNAKFYNEHLGEGKWGANTVISIAIGQGEIMATPLQIANLSATIANRGYYFTPHVVKQIRDVGISKEYTQQHRPHINREYYENVVTGMRMAVTGGTCKGANLPGLDVCGKTGTVQNPHGRDHSVFMGFAPKEDPKIAICVYVENAGFGAQVAVPLGAMVLERYLRGESDEIETRASKWSDKWLEESPSAFEEEEEKLQQLNPDTTLKKPETTAQQSSSSNPIGLPLDREQQQAVLTRPIGDIITRNDIYKG
ncbi:MAG: penicillin-binding protein 2 [Muribaculaceae bacterium]|nr:penicillin-binding protein 2 [Muribaculaceae bacterium]